MNKKLNDHEIDTMLKNYCARRTQYSFDAPLEEKKMITRNGFRFAATAFLIAAVLSAGIFSNFIFKGGNIVHEQNSFFITVNAAEIGADEDVVLTDKEFTPVGKIAPELVITGYPEEESGENSAPYCIGGVLDTHIKCEGSNIEKLTYSISNAVFFLDKDNSMIYNRKNSEKKSFRKSGGDVYWDIKEDESGYYVSLNINGEDSGGAVGEGLTNKDFYSEFTVDYKNREKAFEDINRKSVFAPFEILGGYCNNSDKAMTKQELFENMTNDVAISITATYTDGTSETKTIRLNYEYFGNDNKIISAIIEN